MKITVNKARKKLKSLQDELYVLQREFNSNIYITFTNEENKATALQLAEGKNPLDVLSKIEKLNDEILKVKSKLMEANNSLIVVDHLGTVTVNTAIFELKQLTGLISMLDSMLYVKTSSAFNNLGERQISEPTFDVAKMSLIIKEKIALKEDLQEKIDAFNLSYSIELD